MQKSLKPDPAQRQQKTGGCQQAVFGRQFFRQFQAILAIPQGNKATIGKDLEILFAKRQSFETGINSSQSIVMRSRLGRYWNEVVGLIERAGITL